MPNLQPENQDPQASAPSEIAAVDHVGSHKLMYVDVMRGLAIALVATVHTSQSIGLGESFSKRLVSISQLGVQLFFVASALTLFGSMRKRGVNFLEVKRFFIRRFFRIAPLYYVGIAVYASLAAIKDQLIGGNHVLPYNPINVGMNMMFLHGLYPPANNTIVPGGWSIGTEMLFYAILPILFPVLSNLKRAVLFVVCSFAFSVGLAAIVAMNCGVQSVNSSSFFYFSLANQLPVFACGITLFYLNEPSREWIRAWHAGLVAGVSLFILITLWCSHIETWYMSGCITMLSGLVFASVGLLLTRCDCTTWIGNQMRTLGERSYSIYIFHFIFAWLVVEIVSNKLRSVGMQNQLWLLPLLVILVLFATSCLARISGGLVESRFIRWGSLLCSRLR